MEKSIKEKRLKILSLAMDINEKLGARVFVSYYPHTDWLEVDIHRKPYSESTSKDFKVFIVDDRKIYGKMSHDDMISELEKMLENE